MQFRLWRLATLLWAEYKFNYDITDVNNDAYPGLPSMSTTYENIKAVKKTILDNRRITIRGISYDVDIKRSATKIVPELLNFE